MNSKKAFQFGAGNIGRGFIGQLFYESGYHTTFIDIVSDVVELLNQRGQYPIRIVSEHTVTVVVSNVSAVHVENKDAVSEVIANSEIGATAVGVHALPKVAPCLAAGLTRRFQENNFTPLNIIVCENMLDAGAYLREQVKQFIPNKFHSLFDEKVGFVDASIGRMVPIMTEKEKEEDPLLICVEPYCELPVDAKAFKGEIPEIRHMVPRENFGAYVERKLFVHNMSHAVAAYLGYFRNYEYIWQAIGDVEIRKIVEAALNETCTALARKHQLNWEELDEHARDLLKRYANKGLNDQVVRIAKDPIRKLGPRDRLVGSCQLCLANDVEPEHVALGLAAALFYAHPEDQSAQELCKMREEEGLEGVLQKVCQIAPDSHLGWLVFYAIDRLRRDGWLG